MARTAKQRAATKKLVALNKRRRGSSTKKRSAPKRRKASRRTKVITKVQRVSRMARRRKTNRRSSKSAGVMGSVKRFAKPIAIGLGVPAVIGIAANAVGQPALAQNKLVSAAGAFILGGPIAGGAALLLGGGLGNIFGGGGSTSMEGLA